MDEPLHSHVQLLLKKTDLWPAIDDAEFVFLVDDVTHGLEGGAEEIVVVLANVQELVVGQTLLQSNRSNLSHLRIKARPFYKTK